MSSSDDAALISQLCAITNTDTPSGRVSASHLLQSNGWNLQAALNEHYSGGPVAVAVSDRADRERERERGVGVGTSGGSTTRRTISPSGVNKDARPHVSRVGLSPAGTAGNGGIFWPLRMILRIVTSLWYFLVRSIIPLSFLPHLPRFLLPPSHTTPRSLSTQYHATPIQQCLSIIHSIESETGRSSKDGTLPPFWVGGYKDFLRGLKEEGKVGCVVVGSGEHEDDGVFKSEVLGDAEFIKCLKENEISIWVCDIRYQEGYQVSQTLQVTTYPTILFFSLLPSSTSPTSSSASSSRNKLTILLTLSGPPTSTTSASSLIQAITTSIVPRTRSYLSRLRRERYTAEETRRLREEQDRAVAESERKDRERMRKARKEVEDRERMKVVEAARKERERREKEDKIQRREKLIKERLEWRRWMRRSLSPPEVENGLRVMVRLPNAVGGRAVRMFPLDADDVGLIYNWAETLLIPADCRPEDDPTERPNGRTRWLEEDGGEVVNLFTSYPRRKVENTAGKEMWAVVKDGGGSLVCEVVGDDEESDEEEEE